MSNDWSVTAETVIGTALSAADLLVHLESVERTDGNVMHENTVSIITQDGEYFVAGITTDSTGTRIRLGEKVG